MPPEPAQRKSRSAPEAHAFAYLLGRVTLVFYAVGWIAALVFQSNWDPGARATYGYQLGWLACLSVGAAALLARRGALRLSSGDDAEARSERALSLLRLFNTKNKEVR